MNYDEFLKSKVISAPESGFDVAPETMNHWGDRPGWCMHGYEVEKLIADAPTIVPAEGGTDE